MTNFSVLMSVYRNDKPEFVQRALQSITENQTVKPSEIILMIDGPVSLELEAFIKTESTNYNVLKPIWNKVNQGLGKVLQDGLLLCTNDIVARMDSDDIALPNRFKKQVEYLNDHPNIAVVGGQISEFIGSEKNIVGYRNVPLDSYECKKHFRNRDPLNHMTVMFRKNAVLDAGNYQPWHLDEDTFLWGRLLKKGYKIANLPDVLVNVRVGKDMYARRGGWKYFKSDTKILKWKLDNGLTSYSRFMYNYFVRLSVYVLMPNSVRGWFFRKILRNK